MRKTLSVILFVICFAVVTEARIIDSDAFGLSSVVESFEDLSAGYNINYSTLIGVFEPGVIEPFTFDSGVILSGPIPNPGADTGAAILDKSISTTMVTLGSNGSITSADDIPFGTAFLVQSFMGAGTPIEFSFQSEVLRVGAYVTALNGFVSLSAFDASGQLLETATISSVHVSQWGNNFIGIENTGGISKVQFSAYCLVVDGLTFEIPEPASLLLLCFGGLLIRKR